MTARRLAVTAPAMAAALAGCVAATQPDGPRADAPGLPALAGDALMTADGTRLPLHAWRPGGPVRAAVVALHGFNDRAAMFGLFGPGPWLAAHGVAVYAYDQRGFGAAPWRGIWPGAGRLQSDLRDAAAAVRARHPGVPVLALGHSMGAAVVLAALTGPQPPAVDGAVLVAPAIRGRTTMSLPQRAALWIAATVAPGARLSGEGTGIRASDNIPMLRRLGADPLYQRKSRIDAVAGLVDLMDRALAAATELRGPALVLYGARDEVVPPAAMRAFLAGLPAGAAVRTAAYPEGWHMLLRDRDRRTVWRDILAWIGDPAAPLPSGAGTPGQAASGSSSSAAEFMQ